MVNPPGWAHKPLSVLGLMWPDGDPAQLAVMATDWHQFAADVRQLHSMLNGAVEATLSSNVATSLNAMNDWWNGERGPDKNLLNLAEAANAMGDSLKMTGTKLAVTQFLFLLQLEATVPLVPVILAGGGLAAAALAACRKGAAAVIIALITLLVAYAVHEKIKEKVQPVDTATPMPDGPLVPRSTPSPESSPTSRLEPPDHPDVDWWPQPESVGRCEVPPQPYFFAQPSDRFSGQVSLVRGDGDWRMAVVTNGGLGPIDIQRPVDEYGLARHVITTDGFITAPLANKRQNLEGPMQYWLDIIPLPTDDNGTSLYHRSHMWTWRFGSESGTDVRLASSTFNLSYQKPVENFIVNEYNRVSPHGGWVELTTVMESQNVEDYTYPHTNPDTQRVTNRGVGHQLLKNAYYDIRVCERPGGEMIRTELQLQHDLPYVDQQTGRLMPGAVTVVEPTLRPRRQ